MFTVTLMPARIAGPTTLQPVNPNCELCLRIASAVAVLEKRGNRLLIAYDDSGRAGWLERARWWDYLTWEEFLPGRLVSFPPARISS